MDFPRWTKPTRARVVISLLLLVGLVYTDSLGGGFVQDDEAIYLDDPDKNGVELYWDKPKEQWPRDAKGNLQMITEPLDLEGLLLSAV